MTQPELAFTPVPPPSNQNCGNCYFYRASPDDAYNGCHKKAPTPNIPRQYWWPSVEATDWCGDWEQMT